MTKQASLVWKWVMGFSSGYAVCIVGAGDARIDGMMMGRDMDEARRELAIFNARRAELGLCGFAA
jgi:hypothetical protein